jgi:hypothetical protein
VTALRRGERTQAKRRRSKSLVAISRRLTIHAGSSPRGCTSVCPQPCKRQSPRQDRRPSGCSSRVRTAGAAYGSPGGPSPEVQIAISRRMVSRAIEGLIQPTKINRLGQRSRSNGQVGRDRQRCRFTSRREQTCEGCEENPMSAAGRSSKREGHFSPGQAATARSG